MRLLWTLLLLGLVASAASAAERDSEAEALAVEAQGVVEQYCSDAAGDDVTTAAESVATVSAVWAKVSASLESSRKVYLLYWRGVLGQCLDQEDKALADLAAFLAARGESTALAALASDAQRRVRQLERKRGSGSGPHPGTPGFVLGGVFAAGGAAAGVLSAWQWGQAQNVANELALGVHIGSDVSGWQVDGDRAQLSSRILAGVGAGLGAAGLTAVLLGASRKSARSGTALVPWVSPESGGFSVGIGGRW
jgi:hypothetical protein